jgi:hypothetical protein
VLYYAGGSPSSADYDIEWDVHINTIPTGNLIASAVSRVNTTTSARYQISYSQSGLWTMYYYTSFSAGSSIGTWQGTITAGATYHAKFSMRGSVLTLYIDGIQRIAVTDSSITTTGKAGVHFYNTAADGSGIVIDNFSATDAGATSYAITGPVSGVVNNVSTNFTVKPNDNYTGTITPASTGAGTFLPTSLTWSGNAVAKTFTYTPTSTTGSPHIISVTSSPGIINPTSISYTVNANLYTLTGPTIGGVNNASTFTITPIANYTGTITPASTGAGTFLPTSLTWTGDASAKTFTYTPTSTTGSPHTISVTSSPAITDPTSISYYVNAVSPFIYDSFTGTSGTTLASHTGETGATWTKHPSTSGAAAIDSSGRLRSSASSDAVYYASGSPVTADYNVEWDVHVNTVPTGTFLVAALSRLNTVSGVHYGVRYDQSGAWTLYRYTNISSAATVSSWQGTITAGSTYHAKFSLRGSVLTLYVDGIQRIQVTDSSAIVAAGFVGLETYNTVADGSGIVVDNFSATDAAATSYTFTGPNSGVVSNASTNFIVTPNDDYAGTIIPASTGAGTFSPTSLTWTGDAISKTFTYTPTSTSGSPYTISVTSSPAITNPTSISYTVNTNSYTLTGPTIGGVNNASTFTIAPAGNYTGTITSASTGSGTFSPTSLTWTNESIPKTFTYTPTSTTGSPHTISVTSSPTFTNPTSISFTVDTIFVKDTFTDTAGTTLALHTGETGATWVNHQSYPYETVIDNAGRIRCNTSSGSAYYSSGSPNSADYIVQADVTLLSSNGDYVDIVGRISATSNSYYWFGYSNNQARWQLGKNASYLSTKSEYFGDIGTTHTIQLSMIGNTISGYSDGILKVQAIDTSITSAGNAGILSNGTVTDTTGQHLDNFIAMQLIPVATSYTLTGPTNGTVNSTSTNFTVTPNGTYTGTITPASTGAGTFSPTSLTWTGDAVSKTFTYTPTSTSGSPHTISVTSSPVITNPTSIAYTVDPARTNISVNNSSLYWSRDNVYLNGSSYALMLTTGSYLKTNFSGTSINVNLDMTTFINAGISDINYPFVRYQVDGGAWTNLQLTPSTTKISISGLSSGTHSFRFEFMSTYMYPTPPERWNIPANVIKVTGLSVDEGSTVSAPTILSKLLRVDGDSITEGGRAVNSGDLPSSHSAVLAYPRILSGLLNTELSQIGYGGQGWTTGGTGNVPTYPNAASYYYNGVSRLSGGVLTHALDYWLINEGTNDGANDVTSLALARLSQARIEAGSTTQILLQVPFNGSHRAQLTSAYNSYIVANPPDKNIHLIDLGSISFGTTDGTHPSVAGHAVLANALYTAINNIIPTFSASASADIIQNINSNTVTLTGTNTSWLTTNPTFTISGGTGASITNQTINSDTSVTLTINAGSSANTLTITDPNNNTTATITVLADTDIPETTITSQPSSLNNSTSASFSFSSDDDSATFECKLDASDYEACTSPKNYTSLAEGEHTFLVKAIDLADNEDLTPASYTWTINLTAPTITIANSTITDTTATINWTTGTAASSKVDYGLTNTYGNSTTETDTSTRVINHSVNISNLTSCSTYHYRVHSTDSATNEAISSDNTFTTTGCTGDSDINSQTQSTITTTSGGSLNLLDNGQGITLTVPTSFSTSNANFQIKQLNQDIVIEDTSVPTNYQIIGSSVYDLKALSDVSTKISTFNQPLTITLTYTTADIVGINEASLKIYRYDGSNWNQLNNCSINKSNKTVTCTTNNFSVFGLFGQVQTSSGSSAPLGYANTPTIPNGGFKVSINNNETTTASQNVILNLTVGSDTARMAISNTPDFKSAGQENYAQTKQWNLCQGLATCNPGVHTIYAKYYTQYGVSSAVISDSIIYQPTKPGTTVITPTTPTNTITPTKPALIKFVFKNNLKTGNISNDVKELQKYLNANGFVIAKTGAGSPGKETTKFGALTRQALIKFQKAKKISPAVGYFGPVTREAVNK